MRTGRPADRSAAAAGHLAPAGRGSPVAGRPRAGRSARYSASVPRIVRIRFGTASRYVVSMLIAVTPGRRRSGRRRPPPCRDDLESRGPPQCNRRREARRRVNVTHHHGPARTGHHNRAVSAHLQPQALEQTGRRRPSHTPPCGSTAAGNAGSAPRAAPGRPRSRPRTTRRTGATWGRAEPSPRPRSMSTPTSRRRRSATAARSPEWERLTCGAPGIPTSCGLPLALRSQRRAPGSVPRWSAVICRSAPCATTKRPPFRRGHGRGAAPLVRV